MNILSCFDQFEMAESHHLNDGLGQPLQKVCLVLPLAQPLPLFLDETGLQVSGHLSSCKKRMKDLEGILITAEEKKQHNLPEIDCVLAGKMLSLAFASECFAFLMMTVRTVTDFDCD